MLVQVRVSFPVTIKTLLTLVVFHIKLIFVFKSVQYLTLQISEEVSDSSRVVIKRLSESFISSLLQKEQSIPLTPPSAFTSAKLVAHTHSFGCVLSVM